MNNDLIERLSEAGAYCQEEINEWGLASDFEAAITALSPVLPGDVQAGLEKLKRLKTFGRGREPELAQELTGLIERLAQENVINSNLLKAIEKANDHLHDQIAEYEKALENHIKLLLRLSAFDAPEA